MDTRRTAKQLRAAAAAAALALAAPALTGEAGGYRETEDMAVYVGILPAEMIKGHTIVHGGRTGTETQEKHLVVALFDRDSGERIEDARVSARVQQKGRQTTSRELEPMEIAGTITYGNYFAFPEEADYRVRLAITRSDGASEELDFDHAHFR
jgi:hypothetical protein